MTSSSPNVLTKLNCVVNSLDISPLSGLRRYGKMYDGSLCLVYAAFVADGILHLCFEETKWYEEFQSESSAMLDRLKSVLAENQQKTHLQATIEITKKAHILAKDDAFNYNRAGREKRTYLAEKLFPDCDPNEIYRIVDEATNIDYLAKARSSY